ncbi:SLC13 family permease [Rhodanobacter sp. DHB23]|uniref:SLC13 family permease n=1 Tax=Rhodanobacter sp. DHB23 TaxID=2775923 RepID=UPI0017858804|nr:SLC13 family permease [Rhodanobacter sp. DHB23]MBD8872437.1 citrate transporter [Rhodanobacter sp. DHB23]
MTLVAVASGWRARLKSEWLLLLFAALALALALFDPRPLADYRRWLQLPTLAGLLGLMLAIQGIRDSGLVQHAAGALAARVHSLRALGLLLVTSAALLATVLTNDVSLFLVVPLTLAIGAISNLPVARMAVLEALAVNAGSTLSPIGNPQNLLLWQHAQSPFPRFALAMLPAAAVMFALVAALTLAWLPKGRAMLRPSQVDGHPVAAPLAAGSLLALLLMVLAMEYGLALPGALVLAAAYALIARHVPARIDWLLLATFVAIFLCLGHFAELPLVRHGLDRLALDRPLTLFACGIAISQVISNVPATVLLLDRAHDATALAVAVNVGGAGLAIGSLANLIALRLANQPHGLRLFHRVSIPFLLVSAPLVYLAWRWLG